MRITGGELRGRRILAPRGWETRPTQDRVRESMFAILAHRVEGAEVLDLFAGSGALGFEALSRGASCCTFVEVSRNTALIVRRNAETLGLTGKIGLLNEDAAVNSSTWQRCGPFGIAFLDPPYRFPDYENVMEAIAQPGIMISPAIVVVERDKHLELKRSYGVLMLRRTERYGATCVDFYQSDLEG